MNFLLYTLLSKLCYSTFFIVNPIKEIEWNLNLNEQPIVSWKFDAQENPQDKVELILVKGDQEDLKPITSLGSFTLNQSSIQVDLKKLGNIDSGSDYSIKIINTKNGEYNFGHYFKILNNNETSKDNKKKETKDEVSKDKKNDETLKSSPTVINNPNQTENNNNNKPSDISKMNSDNNNNNNNKIKSNNSTSSSRSDLSNNEFITIPSLLLLIGSLIIQ